MIISRLREILDEHGTKQSWLANKANISQSTLSALAAGRTVPTLEVAYKIAKALNMQIEEVWQHVDEEKEPLE